MKTAPLLWLLLVGFAQGSDQSGHGGENPAALRFAPSYFVANSASQKSGKRLIDNPEVVAFLQTPSGRVLFTPSGAFIDVTATPSDGATKQAERVVLKAGFAAAHGKQRGVQARLEEQAAGKVHFLIGPREHWQQALPTYGKLSYGQVWDGITLDFLGSLDHLEARLTLEPGSDPAAVLLETGAASVAVDPAGDLVAALGQGTLRFQRPTAYQLIDGVRREVAVAYQVRDHGRFSFRLGPYDTRKRLVISPSLLWSSYLGGLGSVSNETASAIAVDGTGHAYIAGTSEVFPTTSGVFAESNHGADVVVAKCNPTGSALLFATFLGGSALEAAKGIAIDDDQNIYVTGVTLSSDFPTTSGAFSQTRAGGVDGFVTKLNSDGTALLYATLIGGSLDDTPAGIAVSASGVAYVAGSTLSHDFPTTLGAFQTVNHSSQHGEIFAFSLNGAGSALNYATYVGGANDDGAQALALDASGCLFVAGSSLSSDFPTTLGSYQPAYQHIDAIAFKLNAAGSALDYATFLGGSDIDLALGLALDADGSAYVTGITHSSDFPTTLGAYDGSVRGDNDVFVCKLSADGTSLAYATCFGGAASDSGVAIAVDDMGAAYVEGNTSSENFPTTLGAFSTSALGGPDLFVVKLNPAGAELAYATYLGGQSNDSARGIVVQNGEAIVLADTGSADFPATSGALQERRRGQNDFALARLNSQGSALIYATFLGGQNAFDRVDEGACQIAVDDAEATYVIAEVGDGGYPVTAGAYSENHAGESDLAITKIAADGSELVFSTFLGGDGYDTGAGIAVDGAGSAYVTGATLSSNFPVTGGALARTLESSDVYVSKLNADGSDLVYSTLLGGSDSEQAFALALDETGHCYVLGTTLSADFPLTPGAFNTSFENEEVFLAKLDPSGTALDYATFLSDQYLSPSKLVVDAQDCAYVLSTAYSAGHPTTTGAYDETYNDASDLHVLKLNATGSALLYGTYLGGSGADEAKGLAVDPSGSAYLLGQTLSSDFPTTPNAFATSHHGDYDLSLSKLDPSGAALAYSTFVGGTSTDTAGALRVDVNGHAYATGSTLSSNFPISPDAFDPTHNGNWDTFAFKLDASGGVLAYSTFLGGSAQDLGHDLVVTADHRFYVLGSTISPEQLATPGTFQETMQGSADLILYAFDLCPGDGPLQVAVDPTAAVQGLDPLTFTAYSSCEQGTVTVQWTNLETGQITTDNPLTLTVTETTELELQVSDAGGEPVVRSIWILYAPNGDLDLNGDGQNTLEDLLLVLPDWNSEAGLDLDGDGMLTVLDFLYINLGPAPAN